MFSHMKKMITAFLAVSLLSSCLISSAYAVTGSPSTVEAGACILMEKDTGTVLYEENADTQLEPASVTKVMTLLLIFEALDSGRISLNDMVTVSAHAASMGGSQVFLEENEQMCVNDMLKAIVVASGNDACVAMGEFIAGSEDGFVSMMNQRAKELGMANTTFQNCTGLPAAGHVTTARDISIMSRELILHHPTIRNYSTIWMDTLRNGAFQLSNTNKLVRFYQGATGLKTGSTDSALYCLSATAERNGMELIAVVLKSPTSAQRFSTAKSLLDFGFANYELMDVFPSEALAPITVTLGETSTVQPVLGTGSKLLIDKSQKDSVTTDVTLCDTIAAPVSQGQVLGEVKVSVNGEVRQTIPIVAANAVNRLTVPGIFKHFMNSLFSGV
jgi:D-alanyl-D-alanine carboxypeptidase (penicillin-binding protein 5/6)